MQEESGAVVSNHAAAEVARVAERMLRGEVELVEGCRKLLQLHGSSGAPDDDAIITIIAIESETDDLPAGPEREDWAADALEEKDRQRDDYLAKVRGPLSEALQLLSERRVKRADTTGDQEP